MDQCKNCIVRGDLERCKATKCSQHDSWFAKEQAKKIKDLETKLKEATNV